LLIKTGVIIVIVAFAFIVLAQLVSPRLKQGTSGYRLGVHLRNGFYANVIFDKWIGALQDDKFKWANLTVKEELEPEYATTQSKL
jgi:hypothetical protein